MPATISKDDCTGCGACEGACPNSAISIDFSEGIAVIDKEVCNDCHDCVEECPSEAIITA